MDPIWGRQDPGGPYVGPMNCAIWENIISYKEHKLMRNCRLQSGLLSRPQCDNWWQRYRYLGDRLTKAYDVTIQRYRKSHAKISQWNEYFAVYGFKIMCDISKVSFELKNLNPYTTKYAFYEELKLDELWYLRVVASQVLVRRVPGRFDVVQPEVMWSLSGWKHHNRRGLPITARSHRRYPMDYAEGTNWFVSYQVCATANNFPIIIAL